MKRTTLLRRCTWISVAAAFALAWVNYWASFAFVVLCVIFAVAWLTSDYVDYQREQERMKQYHNRLKTK
jgi:hypothetical protein